MKAVAVINMPSSCADCDCQFDYVCVLKDIDLESMSSVPEWCPLKSLPNKIDWFENGYNGDWIMFSTGWNACLEELEK